MASPFHGRVGAIYIGQTSALECSAATITITDDAKLDFSATNDFSIEMWLNHCDDGVAGFLLSKYNTAGLTGDSVDSDFTTAGYTICCDATPRFVVADGTSDNTTSAIGSAFNNEQPVHIVATRDADSDISLFIDGVFADSTSDKTTGSLANAQNLIIADPTDSIDFGLLSLTIYNKCLNSTEVSDLYAGRSGALDNIV